MSCCECKIIDHVMCVYRLTALSPLRPLQKKGRRDRTHQRRCSMQPSTLGPTVLHLLGSVGWLGWLGWMRACVARYWWAARRHALKVPWNEEKSVTEGKSTVYILERIWEHRSDWINSSVDWKMARNTSLYFRIVEGRNLPAKDV